MQQPLFIKYGNIEFVTSRFTPEKIFLYAKVDYGRVGGSVEYDEIIRCMTQMIDFLYIFHVQKDLVFKPSIDTDTIHLMDPIYRQKIRILNQQDEYLTNKYRGKLFNMKKFI